MKTPTNPTGEGGGTRPCALGGQPDCNIYIDSSDSSTANSDGDCIWSLAWGRGELSPFLRSLRWRSLHRHVPACRFLILSGLEATITSYQHVLGSTNLRRGRRYCRNPHHECSCSCSRVPHATCPLHMSLHVSHRADGDEWLQQPVHGGKAAR